MAESYMERRLVWTEKQLASRDAEVAELNLRYEKLLNIAALRETEQQEKLASRDAEIATIQERSELHEQAIAAYQAELSMRDVEISRLKLDADDLTKILVKQAAERDQLREQVTELQGNVGLLLRTAKALAATEPKP